MGIYEYGGRNYGDPQRARQARYADESKNFFQYGSTDPSRIATLQAQDQQWQENTANAHAMRQKQADLENELRAKRDDERQRNVLGLSPLSQQLTDTASAAYQTTMENGKTPRENGFAAEMTIGDEAGGAPAPLPMVRPRLGLLNRTIKPEFEDALANAGTPASRTRSVDEMAAIEQAKADERIRVAQQQAQLSSQRDAQNNQARVATAAGRIQASDPTNVGRADVVARDMMTSATMQPPAFSQPAPIEAPAFGGSQAQSPQAIIQQAKQRYPHKPEAEIIAALRAKGLI